MQASLPPNPRQAPESRSAAAPPSLGPTFLTPECGYSVVEGLLYCHVIDDWWLPDDPLFLDLCADYGPLVRNLRDGRRLLRRELRQTISPRRKRQIRDQREMLYEALWWFAPLAAAQADDDHGGAG